MLMTLRCDEASYAAAPEYDFYAGLAALLRFANFAAHHPRLSAWLPRADGYLAVAFKHLPGLGDIGEGETTQAIAARWRQANLLRTTSPLSAKWLKEQLVAECRRLAMHDGFDEARSAMPGDAAIIVRIASAAGPGLS